MGVVGSGEENLGWAWSSPQPPLQSVRVRLLGQQGQSSPAQVGDTGPGWDREASGTQCLLAGGRKQADPVLHPLRHLPGPRLEGIAAEPAGTPLVPPEKGLQAAPKPSTTPGPAGSQQMSWRGQR